MIDPHVHLRDWEQKNKETLKHGFEVAYKAGLDAVFEMPNTNPAITSRELIEERIELANQIIDDLKVKFSYKYSGLGRLEPSLKPSEARASDYPTQKKFKFFHGIYAGITNDSKQIEEMVKAHQELFPRVVGLKMFAGQSIGNMGIIKEEEQKLIYQTLAKLNYKGVLAVHCEKEDLMKPEIWTPEKPITHTQARPPMAEIESVKDQIRFAQEAGFEGILHVLHITMLESLEEIEKARNEVDFKITCGLTPHHAMLYDEMMEEESGLLLKMNPPLRTKETQEKMSQALFDGRIDWIETDHAPHLLKEKVNQPYSSGIPGFPFYPRFIKFLKEKGMSEKMIENLTHNNITNTFGFDIKNTKKEGDCDLAGEYEFDGFEKLGV